MTLRATAGSLGKLWLVAPSFLQNAFSSVITVCAAPLRASAVHCRLICVAITQFGF